MSDTYPNTGKSLRPAFTVFGTLKDADENLEQMIGRTAGIIERLCGPSPENAKACGASSSSIEGTAEAVRDKLHTLMNNIAAIDNYI